MSTETLLQRCAKVKETGLGRWVACCPAHDDRSPSLAIRECGDGKVLVYCHAGCESEDVLAAVNLSFADLMPERIGAKYRRSPLNLRFDAKQVLAALAHEIMVVGLITERVAGIAAIAEDQDRLLVAMCRVQNALDMSKSIGTPIELKRIRRAER